MSATAAAYIDRGELWRCVPEIRARDAAARESTRAMRAGHWCEPFVAMEALDRMGLTGRALVTEPGTMLAPPPDDEWACATPDRLVLLADKRRLNLECKLPLYTADAAAPDGPHEWGPDGSGWGGVSHRYVPQVLWQGWALACEAGSVVAAYFGGEDLRLYDCPRWPEAEQALRAKCRAVWERHVRDAYALPPDASRECMDLLTRQWPEPGDDSGLREASTENEVVALQGYLAAKGKAEQWKEARDRFANELRALIGNGYGITLQGLGGVRWQRHGRGGRALVGWAEKGEGAAKHAPPRRESAEAPAASAEGAATSG